MSRWKTVAIYGVGLIGGSIGMALKQRGLADSVVGIGRNADRLSHAVQLGAVSDFVTRVEDLRNPDLVVLCTPVQRLVEHCQWVARQCDGVLITDVGSTKKGLVDTIERDLPHVNFIGSHPLAGSDKSGVENADARLFCDRTAIVTPTEASDRESLREVNQFWEALGARTVSMTPETHDRLLAVTSHLPHVVASALSAETPIESLKFVAGGWCDTTRIAASDVDLWTQILLENNNNVLDALKGIQLRLRDFEAALDSSDRESITRLLAAGKRQRDALGS